MFHAKRVLIWGKTYPELRWKSQETVCTGGCTEDGRPIRLYPVKLRYLARHQQYGLYDWIEVPVERNTRDPRPESHRVNAEQLRVVERVGTDHGWRERAATIFSDRSWHYACVEDLKARQRNGFHSLGFVPVGEVDDVRLVERAESERKKHEVKLAELRSTLDLFSGVEQKDLEFIPYRVVLRWRCERLEGANACPGHTAAVLDWGLMELGRKRGPEAARQKMEELADLRRYDLRLFMGNFFTHQTVFGIIALWYPLRRELGQTDLFNTG
jgi:hypothetical protein